MSKKEQLISLLDNMPDYKIDYVIAYVQGLTADENAENEYCENIVSEYLKKDTHETISFENAIREAGFSINDL